MNIQQNFIRGEVEPVITLKRLNGTEFVLNCDLIETIESTPDTVITTTDNKKWVVIETVEQVVEKVIQYKRKISQGIGFDESK